MATRKVQEKEKNSRTSHYLFIGFFLLLLVLAFLVVRPFITLILTSAVISYVLYPLFKRLRERTGRPSLSAAICIIIALIVVAVPIFFVASQVVDEGYSIYRQLKDNVGDGGGPFEECENKTTWICSLYLDSNALNEKYGFDMNLYIKQGIEAIAAKALSFTTGILLKVPTVLFQIFVMIFLIFFMLVDGKKALAYMWKLLPLNRHHEAHIARTFTDLIHATLYGAVLIAVIQGVLAGIGFLIFGVNAPFLWGMLSIIAAFLPFVGASIIWVPIVLKMVVEGLIISDNTLLLKALGLFLYCFLFVSTIDNVIKPKIVGDKAKLHPVIVLLGVFGGLALFGFVGIIIGPLLLALFIAMLRIYEDEKKALDR
ncbi:MAG: AI-2E family transporter [Nanoarchaeota archaeon]|nr:AI-2E family transporter [Nanoarchaeota archaeon]